MSLPFLQRTQFLNSLREASDLYFDFLIGHLLRTDGRPQAFQKITVDGKSWASMVTRLLSLFSLEIGTKLQDLGSNT